MPEDEKIKITPLHLTPQMYDMYAPVVFGKILSIVSNPPFANKILEKVFTNAYVDKSTPFAGTRSPLINLLNHTEQKTGKMVKALNLFRDCCNGNAVCSIAPNQTKADKETTS